ncbi:MAG: DNA translocase FtsK [Rikenellaceae bacterium]
MASKNNTNNRSKNSNADRSKRDSRLWFFGLTILSVGLFIFISILFYYIDWKSDFDLVTMSVEDNPRLEFEHITNPSGVYGAWIAERLVGRSFGVVGIIIPIFLMIVGFRIARQRPLRLHRVAFSSMLLLLFGSTTFGFLFGINWPVFNSGLGGMFGIEISNLVAAYMGNVGVVIILVLGWLATAYFINHNFISAMNSASSAAFDKSGKIVNKVKENVAQNVKRNVKDTPLYGSESVDEVEEEINIKVKEQPQSQSQSQPQPVETIVEPPVKPITPVAMPTESFGRVMTLNDKYSASAPISIPTPTTTSAEEYIVDGRPTEPKNIESALEIVTPEPEPVAEGDGGVVVSVEANKLAVVEGDIEQELYDPLKDLYNYQIPSVSLLEDYQSASEVTDDEIFENKSKIEDTLKHFGIPIQKIKATVGPTITLYEIIQAQGVKISKIQGLENDIAQNLKALGIRIIAPIPGRGTIGIEVPNHSKQVVSMYSSVRSLKFQEMKAELPIVIGRTIQNESYVFDLAKMPHLLVAGATGQGKSVGLNAIITSLLYRKHPSQLKFVMIDPKMVEFSPYKNLENHFMAKMESEDDVIITDPKKAVYTLNSLCEEMEKRLKLLSQASVRNIVEYNDKFTHRKLNPDKGHFYMPYIVVIVDEFADLIMMSREVETPVMRLAQKARAVGIHLIVATQRPDVKVITGGIKANFPARIAFRVMQMIDSRTIIDQSGANQLIGRGDMLFSKDGELTRIQCALVETDEVTRVVKHISEQQGYSQAYMLPDFTPDGGDAADMGDSSGAAVKYDALFTEIARAAVLGGSISTSAIQRNFEVGFNRAGRIMTQLERAGIVGRAEGAKPREILFYDMASLEAKLQSLGLF